ncbi:peptidoglycan DD-metalloendopeptidase family protein [Sphingomonas sp. BK235]|uniref:murein hydrolase activator EnvC family protein n=1 Tax=Sphingomonas sp. BK235 TaxID=2512131 RepID=UPI001053773E|nr:peptidoglycan DD-metalloendopeptidase family protein [Sphingomonas sp. BK235]TCP34615.1 septal ring factor EnvC (AmiA/AmiB activator) [Sphingomonas sp. BK235]
MRLIRLGAALFAAALLGPGADALPEPAARRAAPSFAGAEAEIAAERARAAAIATRLARQRARLAAEQGPVVRLVAAAAAMARRPRAAVLARPGSVSDLVHVEAVLGAQAARLDQRTARLRGALARTRALSASAQLTERALVAERARLVEARERLAALAGDDERALALEESARDTADRIAALGGAEAVLGDLIALPGPPRSDAPAARPSPAYRLPATGRLITGLGELSDNGVRSRGLTLAVTRGATLVAPAAGVVRYVGPFRSYGTIVILDHGAGWQTLVTGVGAAAVARGDRVAAGAALGRAPDRRDATVTVELRRRGVPVDVAQLAG